MIKIFNANNEQIELVENLKDFVIVDKIKNGFSSLLFSLYRTEPVSSLIKEEFYIETQENRYVVKSINKQQTVNRYTCELDLESLKSKIWTDGFSNALATVDATVRLAIAGTGWTVVTENLSTKKRKITLDALDSYEIIKKCLLKWDVEVHFNAKDKVITLSDKFGTDKGVYFSDELNLKSIDVEGDSYDFATRIYVRGREGLTFSDINNGKDYVEDYTYSSKLVAKLWVDERYDNKEQLLEDARRKLKDLREPKYSYEIEVVDLSNLSNEYSFLSYAKGDTITLLSSDKKIRETHRIIEMSRYPLEPERNTVTLSNGRFTLEELQEKNENMADAVDLILNEDGSIIGTKVDNITTSQISDFEASVGKIADLTVVNAKIENLETNKASVGQLSAVQADIGELRANSATIDQLTATNAKISTLEADNVTINGTLNANNAKIETLEADTATIKHLVSGNISSENIQSGGITSDKLTIANGFIKDAMIDSLSANKINAGTIDTSLINVTSKSGNLVINDNTIQIRDTNRVRVQIGKDAANDYSMSVWDTTGKLMFDARGLKTDAIKDSIIRDDMISEGANIDGSKLNINSVVSSINNGSSTLKASKIQFDGIAQTLEVAFNSLKTQADETKSTTESNTTAINVAQGEINTLIQDTTIIKDGRETKLKDEYSKLEQTVSGINTTVGKQQTTIDDHTGKITSTNSEISSLKQSVSGLNASVSTVQTTVETHSKEIDGKANVVDVYTIAQTDAKINLAKNEINLSVSEKYSTKQEVNDLVADLDSSFSVMLSNEAQVIPTNTNRYPVQNKTYSTGITVYQGTKERTDYVIGTIASANGLTVSKTTNSVSFAVKTTTALSLDDGTFTIPITIDGKTFNKVFSWAVSKQGVAGASGSNGTNGTNGANGADAQYVIVTGEQTFRYTNNFTGTPTPASITLTASAFGFTSASYQWSYRVPASTTPVNISGATSASFALTHNASIWGSHKQLTLRCTVGGKFDEITIVKVSDGAKGDTGATGGSGKGIKSTAITYQASSNGTTAPTGTWNTAVPSVSAGQYLWTRTITTYTDNTTSTAYSVGRMGTNGTNGTNGSNAMSADIVASSQVFKSTDGGLTFSPSTVTLTPILQYVTYSNWQYSVNGGSTWTTATSGSNGLTISGNVLTVSKDSALFTKTVTTVIFRLNTSNSSVYDTMSIVKLYDVTDIEIGGRNLLINTNIKSVMTKDSTAPQYSTKTSNIVDKEVLKQIVGKKITLSVYNHSVGDGQTISGVGFGERFGCHLSASWKKTDGTTMSTYPCDMTARFVGNSKSRVFVTETLNLPTGTTELLNLTLAWQPYKKPASTNTETWVLSQPKLEIGNKPTDWTPAPEDVDNEFTTVKETMASIDIKADSIISQVGSVESGLNNRINEEVKQLVQTNNEIKAELNEILDDDVVTEMEKRLLRDTQYEFESQFKRIQDTINLYDLSRALEIIYSNYCTKYQDVELAFRDMNLDEPSSESGGIALQGLINAYLDSYNQILYGISEHTQSEQLKLSTQIVQTDKKIENIVSTVDTVNGVTTNVSKHMSFGDNWLELYGTINGSASRFKARLSDARLSFFDGGNEVAYISNQKMFINEAEIVEGMKIGNYIMTSSANGGIVFRKV